MNKGDNLVTVSGDTDNVVGINEDIINGNTPTVSYPGALLVDLGVASNGFADENCQWRSVPFGGIVCPGSRRPGRGRVHA